MFLLSGVVEAEVPSMLSGVVESSGLLGSPGVSVLEPLRSNNKI